MPETDPMLDTDDEAVLYDLGARRNRQQTAADSLVGVSLPGGWQIGNQLDRRGAAYRPLSGGNFSVCYEAQGPGGAPAIIKAFDFEHTIRAPDPISETAFWTRMFEHERELLKRTSGIRRTARRVVRLLAWGTILCRFEGEPTTFPVPYLVLERADVDLRALLSASDAVDDAWLLTCVHDVAAALYVLHAESIAHGDTKPSNVMYFRALNRSKLGDLGSATTLGEIHPAVEDRGARLLGDTRYAPPEYYYGYEAAEWDERYRAVDLYLLGQLTLYLLTFENMTARIIEGLSPNHQPKSAGGSWRGSFANVLPHLESAYEEVITELRSHLTGRFEAAHAADIARLVGYLCHPDPARRGHPRNQDPFSAENPFALTRFVSSFGTLAKKAKARARARAAGVSK